MWNSTRGSEITNTYRFLKQFCRGYGSLKPQAVFYQSGVDGLASDELGHLELTHAGLLARDPLVMRQVREQALPLELTVEAHANTLCTAREIFSKDGR